MAFLAIFGGFGAFVWFFWLFSEFWGICCFFFGCFQMFWAICLHTFRVQVGKILLLVTVSCFQRIRLGQASGRVAGITFNYQGYLFWWVTCILYEGFRLRAHKNDSFGSELYGGSAAPARPKRR